MICSGIDHELDDDPDDQSDAQRRSAEGRTMPRDEQTAAISIARPLTKTRSPGHREVPTVFKSSASSGSASTSRSVTPRKDQADRDRANYDEDLDVIAAGAVAGPVDATVVCDRLGVHRRHRRRRRPARPALRSVASEAHRFDGRIAISTTVRPNRARVGFGVSLRGSRNGIAAVVAATAASGASISRAVPGFESRTGPRRSRCSA